MCPCTNDNHDLSPKNMQVRQIRMKKAFFYLIWVYLQIWLHPKVASLELWALISSEENINLTWILGFVGVLLWLNFVAICQYEKFHSFLHLKSLLYLISTRYLSKQVYINISNTETSFEKLFTTSHIQRYIITCNNELM